MKGIEMKRGQPITFRIPSDTPDHILRHLEKLKETERRNFSSKIAEFVMTGVGQSLSKHRETLTIPLPKGLNKAQRNWLKHEQSQALLGSIVYQLLTDPVRTASLIASLNKVEVDDYPYFMEESTDGEIDINEMRMEHYEPKLDEEKVVQDDDLENFDWHIATEEEEISSVKEETEDIEDLLGDFLAQMNK
ncbi:hypothetical protein ACQKP0_09745 [Heyndrickxia sp. NPDC080065]|uniref:hypothetical protein n=1 Tax=Heyndrickxia sp. NPDC080065 TaxID=3390568 RepID=UPI003D00A1AA